MEGSAVSFDSHDFPLVRAATQTDAPELARLYIAYRIFYGQAPEEQRAAEFILDRLTRSEGRYFLASNGPDAIGFMHLMLSTNTLAMRPIWLLEDLYVDTAVRGQGVATGLLRHAEAFARSTGAERLTLATARDNLAAQHIYRKLGYVREDHFLYFHRLLEPLDVADWAR